MLSLFLGTLLYILYTFITIQTVRVLVLQLEEDKRKLSKMTMKIVKLKMVKGIRSSEDDLPGEENKSK